MSGSQQRVVGYGPPGGTYPHIVVVESQQPGPDSIELQIILDDRRMTDHIRYTGSDKRRRMVRTKVYDDERMLQYAELSLLPETTQVILEPFAEGGKRIDDLCCCYDLYACRFTPVGPDAEEGFTEGIKEEGGVRVKYAKVTGNDYDRAQRIARDADRSTFSTSVSTFFDLLLLATRCYLGALAAQELGWRKPEQCVVGALILGLISTRTLGSTVSTLLGSNLLKVSALFVPVLGTAFLALNPSLVEQMVSGPGITGEITLWLDRVQFQSPAVLYGVQWALVALVAMWFLVWVFAPAPEDADDEKARRTGR